MGVLPRHLNLESVNIVLITCLVLLLAGAREFFQLAEGFRKGIQEFKRASRDVFDDFFGGDGDNF